LLDLIEIRKDSGHYLAMLSVPALRNIRLSHRLEVHRGFLRPNGHGHLPDVTFDTLN